MPNLPTHLSLAMATSESLALPVVQRHLGSFLLGSTTPDIRAMTKGKRDDTHFAPLDITRVGEGMGGLLRTHPDLSDSSKVNDATKVFLSGYFTHLVADETWILKMYRTYFDGQRVVDDGVLANIWDRALQLGMDRAAGDELDGMGQVRSMLQGAEVGVDVGFIEPEILAEWTGWVTEFITREFSWDRLRFATRRMYQDDPHASEMVEKFLQNVPDSLESVYEKIPEERLAQYRQQVITEAVRLIREYLGEP